MALADPAAAISSLFGNHRYPRRRARVSTRLCRLHILLPISIQCDSIPPATTSFLLFVLSSHSLSDFPTASHARAELPVRLAPIFHRSTHARLSWQPLLQRNSAPGSAMAEFSKFSKILFQLLKKPQRLDQDDRVSDVDSQPHNVCPRKQPSPIASKIRLYALSYF